MMNLNVFIKKPEASEGQESPASPEARNRVEISTLISLYFYFYKNISGLLTTMYKGVFSKKGVFIFLKVPHCGTFPNIAGLPDFAIISKNFVN
jgi:hypothetical protein